MKDLKGEILKQLDKDFPNVENWKYEIYVSSMIKVVDSLLSQQSKTPMGVSQWREYGKRYKYWQYFEEEVRKEVLEEVMKTLVEYADNQQVSSMISSLSIERIIKSLINKQ